MGHGPYPYLVGLFGELREILNATLKASREMQDMQREGWSIRRLGEIFWVRGQYEEALDCMNKAEEAAHKYNDNKELVKSSIGRQIFYSSKGI